MKKFFIGVLIFMLSVVGIVAMFVYVDTPSCSWQSFISFVFFMVTVIGPAQMSWKDYFDKLFK